MGNVSTPRAQRKRRSLLGSLTTMAVLSSTLGLSALLVSPASAAPGDPVPVQNDRNYSAVANSIQVSVSLSTPSSANNGSALLGYNHLSSSRNAYSASPDPVQQWGATGLFMGAYATGALITPSPGPRSAYAQITAAVPAATYDTEAADNALVTYGPTSADGDLTIPRDGNWGAPGPIIQADSTFSAMDVEPYEFKAGVTLDPLTIVSEGGTISNEISTIDIADTDSPGIKSVATARPGVYRLFDDLVTVEVVGAGELEMTKTAYGVAGGAAEVTLQEIYVTAPNMPRRKLEVNDGQLTIAHPTKPGLSMQLNVPALTQNLTDNFVNANTYAFQARYFDTANFGASIGYVNVGQMNASAVISIPGATAGAMLDGTPIPDTDEDGLNDYQESNGSVALGQYGTRGSIPDTDQDGLLDGEEVFTYQSNPKAADSDNDGLTDKEEADLGTSLTTSDTDSDGLSDIVEVNESGTDPTKYDTDEDGLSDNEYAEYGTDALNDDSDSDGLLDGAEVENNYSNPLDADTDNGGALDGEEASAGTDPRDDSDDEDIIDSDSDGLTGAQETLAGTDPRNPDTDGDGLTDGQEVNTFDTDPTLKDTDEDGLDDNVELGMGTEARNADSDGDGLKDGEEVNKYNSDPLMVDTDRDNLEDKGEVTAGTNPRVQDTDGDTLWDGDEVRIGSSPLLKDTDGGSVDDAVEYDRGTNPLDPSDDVKVVQPPLGPPVAPVKDADGDGLIDEREVQLGTDPNKADTDGDHLTDWQEVQGVRVNKRVGVVKTNPLLADTDKDGLKDGVEVEGFVNKRYDKTFKSNPVLKDSDDDGLNDKAEVKGLRNKKFNLMPTNPLRRNTDRQGGNDKTELKWGNNPAKAEKN